jgi:hypothetical protein
MTDDLTAIPWAVLDAAVLQRRVAELDAVPNEALYAEYGRRHDARVAMELERIKADAEIQRKQIAVIRAQRAAARRPEPVPWYRRALDRLWGMASPEGTQ